jgi:hypothetical protein
MVTGDEMGAVTGSGEPAGSSAALEGAGKGIAEGRS